MHQSISPDSPGERDGDARAGPGREQRAEHGLPNPAPPLPRGQLPGGHLQDQRVGREAGQVGIVVGRTIEDGNERDKVF
jgi:hypothetical protein